MAEISEKDITILSVKDIIKSFKQRVKKDFDVVAAITGEEGMGKSSLATLCVIESLLYDGLTREEAVLKFPEYTIFSPNKQRVKEQITKAERYSVINSDEAIKILYKLNWNSDIQKFLNMLYALCRKENKITLLCMPRFTDFNEFFRKHRIKFWIHILDRGVGVVFGKDWNPFTDDPWWMKDGMDVIKKGTGRTKMVDFDTEEKIRILSKVRNFIGIIKFDDLDNDIKKVYKKGKEEFGYEDMEAEDVGAAKRAEKYQDRIETTIRNLSNKGMSTNEISIITNTPRTTIYGYLKKTITDAVQPILNNKTPEKDNFNESMEDI
jgi:hypothetical protein